MTVFDELNNPVACEWHIGQLLRAMNQLRDGRPSPMVVRDTSNIRWLTAFDGVFDDEDADGALRERGAVRHAVTASAGRNRRRRSQPANRLSSPPCANVRP